MEKGRQGEARTMHYDIEYHNGNHITSQPQARVARSVKLKLFGNFWAIAEIRIFIGSKKGMGNRNRENKLAIRRRGRAQIGL